MKKCEICGEPMFFIKHTVMENELYTCKNGHSMEITPSW